MSDETLIAAESAHVYSADGISPGNEAAPGLTFVGDADTGVWSNADGVINFSTNAVKRFTIDTVSVSSTLPIYVLDGTVTVPSLTFTGDTNTGFYSIGADQLGITTGGVLRFNIGSTLSTVLPFYATLGSASAPSYSFTGSATTGMYASAADTINFSAGGVSRLQISASAATLTIPVYAALGSAAAPSYSFSGDTDTGIFSSGANTIDFATSGISRLQLTDTSLISTVPYLNANGSASAPAYAFSSSTNTGLYSNGVSVLNLATGGVSRMQINTTSLTSTLPILAPNGSVSAPAYTFTADTNTGIYGTSGTILFTCGGTSKGQFNSSGFTINSGTFFIQDGSAATPGLRFLNDAGTAGIYRSTTNTINMATAGTLRFTLNTSGLTSTLPIYSNGGSFSTPSYSLASGMGMYLTAANEIELVSAVGGGDGSTYHAFRVSTASGWTCARTDGGSFVQPNQMMALEYYGGSWTTNAMAMVDAYYAGSLTAWNFFSCTNSGGLAFRVRGDGAVFADGTYSSSGADYAEYFESADGKEIPIGSTVILENGKIRRAIITDILDTIIGVVRPKNSNEMITVGNSYENYWQGKYEKDEFGADVFEAIDIYQWTDEKNHQETKYADELPQDLVLPENKIITPSTRKKKSLTYDPNADYIPRSQRPEWLIVGMLGQVPIKTGELLNPNWILLGNVGDGTIAKRYLIK